MHLFDPGLRDALVGHRDALLEPALFNANRTSNVNTTDNICAGLTFIGWQGVRVGWWQPCLRLAFDGLLILPMEPELAPYGWRCPHRRPTYAPLMGSTGNMV
jgi:hypothetical protein